MKAHLYSRVLAYLIDVIIIAIVVSIISSFVLPPNNVEILQEELGIIMDEFVSGKISLDVYFNRMLEINYDISYQNIGHNIILFIANVLYFIIYQFNNNGQTIGKKIMKIKVTKDKGQLITMDDMAKRSLLINGLFIAMVDLLGIIILSDTIFFGLSTITGIIQFAITIVGVFMILYRKDGRALHDLFAGTKVIEYKGE